MSDSSPAMPAATNGPSRSLARDGSFETRRVGAKAEVFGDVYHALISASWPLFLAGVALAYVMVNAVFATAYLAGGDCIENTRPNSFADAFFFSVQTLATIGYGGMAPRTTYAHIVVAVEALVGLLGFAVGTGLMFTKFARPTTRVLWSNTAVVSKRNGVPHLLFRVANVRSNHIVEATIRVSMLMTETTAEGETMRRFYDMPLVRSQNPIFALTWLVMHPIDERSPMFGKSTEELLTGRAESLAILVGVDGTFSQTVHDRHAYALDDIIENARFADMIGMDPKGKRTLDLGRIHDVVRLAEAP